MCSWPGGEAQLLLTRIALPCPLQKDDSSHLHQLILHASLDVVEERVWDTPSMYLKARGERTRPELRRA